jgi:hypothetical protein
METTGAQLGILKNAVTETAINLGTALLPAIQSMVGGLQDAAQAIASFAEAHPEITKLAGLIGGAIGSIKALEIAARLMGITGVASTAAFGNAVKALNADILTATTSVGLLRSAAVLGGAAFAGWKIGGWLTQFEAVRKAGVLMTETLVRGVERWRYQWELTKAAFTDDTFADATQRHNERLRIIEQTLKDTWRAAEEGAAKAASATDAATEATDEMAFSASRAAAELERAARASGWMAGDGRASARALSEALRALGVDAEAATAGITSGAREAGAAFAAVVEEIHATGTAAEDASKIIDASMTAALKRATNAADVEHLIETFRALGQAGELTGEELARGLAAGQARLEEFRKSAAASSAGVAALGAQAAATRQEVEALGAAAKETSAELDALEGRRQSSLGTGVAARDRRLVDLLERIKALGPEAEESYRNAIQAAQSLRRGGILTRSDLTGAAASTLYQFGVAPSGTPATAAQREDADTPRREYRASRTVRVEFGAGGPAGDFEEEQAEQLIRLLERQGATGLDTSRPL